MNNKLYVLTIEMINITIRFLIAIGVLSLFFLLLTGSMDYANTLWFMLPAPYVSHMIAKYANRIWVYISLHLLIIITYGLVFHNNMLIFIYSSYLVVLAVMNLSRKIHHNDPITHTSLVLLLFDCACYLYYDYIHINEWKTAFLYISLLYIALYFINLYLNNFREVIIKYQDIAHLPIRQIEVNNHLLFAFFGIFSIICVFLLRFLPYGHILSFIKRVLFVILKFVLSLFDYTTHAPKPSAPSNNSSSPAIIPERSVFWEVLSTILNYAIIIALLIALIAGIIYGLNAIYKKFYLTRLPLMNDRVEFISPFTKKENTHNNKKKSFNGLHIPFFGKSYNEKIRKHYYHAVMNNLDINKLPRGITPSQLSRHILNKDATSPDINLEQELTGLYEKARYSQEECTKTELHRMQAYMKRQNSHSSRNDN